MSSESGSAPGPQDPAATDPVCKAPEEHVITAPQDTPAEHLAVDLAPPKKKKKSKRKNKNRKCVTGFEEYFCDAPTTPQEHAEERRLYDASSPFLSRIEECIQRYRARRRMDNEQEAVFTKYLMLGGVDSSPRMFQSTRDLNDDETFAQATTTEMLDITADDVIQRNKVDSRYYSPADDEHWVVDFTGVAAGFISYRLFHLVGSSEIAIERSVKVIVNFLKYIEQHDVCPEYADDIKRAQAVCHQAIEELPYVLGLMSHLPGNFNSAARILYCQDDGDDDETAAYRFDNGGNGPTMSPAQAKAVFFATMVSWTAPVFCDEILRTNLRVEMTFEHAFEILPLEDAWLPNVAMANRFARIRDGDGKLGGVQPTGSVFLRPVDIESGWVVAKQPSVEALLHDKMQFFFEEAVIDKLRPGMKLLLVVCKLNIDLLFIKDVKQILPSFYTFLPQELMLKYREPVLNERPAPIGDDSEEDVADVDADGDADADI